MSVNNLLRSAKIAMATCACAALLGTAGVAAAQMQVLGGSSPTEDSSQAVPSQRLVLHGVRIKGDRLLLDPGSRAVLDYAARVLREHPRTLVFFGSEGVDTGMQRHAQAIAAYLKRHGVAADRLMVPASLPVPSQDLAASPNPTRDHVIVLNLTTAEPCGECS